MNVLFCVSGVVWLYSRLTKMPQFGDKYDWLVIVTVTIPVGLVIGLFISRIVALSIYWTGKIVDGQSSYKEVLRTTAYANVPSLGLLVMLIVKFLIFGKEPISSLRPEMADNVLIVSFITIIEAAIGIWNLVIYIKVVSETQRLTIGMAIINLLMAFTIVGLFNYFVVIKWLES